MSDALEARSAAMERFVTLYSACPSGIALADAAGKIAEVNPALAALLEVDAEQLRGGDIAGLGAGEKDRALLAERLDELATEPAGVRTDSELLELTHPDGKSKRAYVTFTSIPADNSGAAYPVLFAEDADELCRLRETFEHHSVSDPLTNLANISRFKSYLESTIGTQPDGQIALIYLDIDGFKVINDGLGGDAADEVLRGVAARLDAAFDKDTVDTVDTAGVVATALLARLSGDGFGAVLRGEFTATEVVDLVERAIDDLAEPVYADDIGVGVSASAGIVVRPARGAEPNRLIEAAQIALHRAKEKGKAQWVLYDSDIDSADRAQYRLGAAIAGGLETGEFTVVYRPCVVLPDAAIVTSLKAELRWNNPELGLLRADEFYGLADTTGMTVPLGRHLLAHAAETAADWRQRFGENAPTVCLYLPTRLAIDGDLVGIVKTELGRYDLPISALWLCSDCSSILDGRGDFLESLRILVEAGMTFTIDVTGSADLEVIHNLAVPAPGIMLAGDVVAAIAVDQPTEAAKRHVTQLVQRAGELGIVAGATGVTSEEHAARLHELGVLVSTGPYLRELPTREDAESWAGHVWRG